MATMRKQIQEARKEGYSDGDIAAFLSEADPRIAEALSEGYKLDQIANYVDLKEVSLAAPLRPEFTKPEFLKDVGRQLGLTARYGIEGVGGVADFLATPFRAAVNVAAPEGMQAQPLAPQIADMLGLPQPETPTERVVGQATRGMASAATGVGAAQAARPVSQLGQNLRNLFTTAPGTQITSAGSAGAGSSLAAEMGFEETGQMIAGLGAGIAPAAAPALATRNLAAVQPQTRQIIGESRQAGYSLPPSQTNPSLTNKVVESLSGKVKTNQAAAQKNQEITNNLAKKSLGIPKDQPLTQETLNTIRSNAGRAYDDLSLIGNVSPDKAFFTKLDKIVDPYVRAAKGFPDAKANPIIAEINALKSESFPASAGIAKIRELREAADTAYAAGNKALGKSYKEAASAIEDALDAQAQKISAFLPPDLLKNFRESRKLIAKTYSVQRALNEASGNVVATNLAAQLKRGVPLEGELRTIARTAQAFPKAVQPLDQMGQNLPLSPLDFGAAALLFGTTQNPFAVTSLVARPLARSTILSSPYQATLGRPGGVFASRLSRPEELAAGGLLGTQYGINR
jgi:hypothetical protein